MINGQITVRIALEKGPFDTVEEIDWTDLTDRVRAYSDERGRDDVLQPFGPGTARVVLANFDRALDPSNPDGLLFNDDDEPIGLPLCPVEIGCVWDGTTYPKFTGYLGPEAWPGDIASKGPSGTVTLNVVDAIGHSPGLPGDAWSLLVCSMYPDWYSRMDDFEFPVLIDGLPVPDSITGGHGTLEGSIGYSSAFSPQGADQAAGVFAPGLLLVAGDHQVRFPAAGIMPDGDQDKFTAVCWWVGRTEVPAGERSDVMKCVHPTSGLYRWSVYIDGDDGLAYVTTFDAAEVEVDTAVIEPLWVFDRWDINQTVSVVARFDGADEALTVWFGGVSATLSAPAYLYESDLIIGPTAVDAGFDEVAMWRRALDYENEIAPLLLSGLSVWAGQTFADRLGKWMDAAGRAPDFDDTNQWHLPADVSDSLWGLIHREFPTIEEPVAPAFQVTLPDTLADAFQITVAYGAGARWATKHDWLIRARTIHALTDPTYAEFYNEPVLFTDRDDTLGADEYRHAGVDVTGLRIDRVINDATVSFLFSQSEPPEITGASPMVSRKRDVESIGRYGRRIDTTESEWAEWALNQTVADLKVARFAQPHQEIENIHLDPLGDDDLAEWLITTCELELACSVEYTPSGAAPVLIEGLNIQHIAWSITAERWTVDLVAAKS